MPEKGLKPAELLFAVHTYYAVFMKLLASEIVAFFHKLPTPLQKMMQAGTSAKLRREMEELEAGSIFRHLNITNFLEGDLFAWYTSLWTDEIEQLIRKMVTKLDEYNPGTMSEDPAGSRDLLQRLYQQLFPKSVRHDLGEYYTPDWLAEEVLDELQYVGDPDKRILDPACGSGTFLVMAITRIRRWHDENRERCSYEEDDLCRKILANVVGFDLNPLAVMAARTNYLIAIRGLVSQVEKIEIPIYLCDSILTPSEYGGDLFCAKSGTARELKTAAARFLIPTEIASDRDTIARYAEQLEFCVRNEYTVEDFLARCKDESLPMSAAALHSELFRELVELDKANKNGVWARIIKNSFAPLFIGKVDYVAGNPPWVNWESLPKEYRDTTIGIWDKYRLRERATPGARLGNVKKELSVLFVYVACDHYLAEHGKLGFLITQTIFKSGAAEGFRRFAVARNRLFRVSTVADLSLFLPFENAVNRTAVLIVENGAKTEYPVPYRLWIPLEPLNAAENDLKAVRQHFRISNWLADHVEPSVKESTWLTTPEDALPIAKKVIGDRSAKVMENAYAGSCTWLNGVFWVERIKRSEKSSLVQNLGATGRKKVETVTAQVENTFLFPLLRGRDVLAWSAKPSAMILVPHNRDDFGEPISLTTMKQMYPQTFSFFKRFEGPLKGRSGYKQLHGSRAEFYVVGNVGNYALAPYKVVFKDLSEFFQCAVVGPQESDGGVPTPVIPDHTLLFLTCESEDRAHFIAGLLNSAPARVALYCSSVGVQTQRYFPTDVSRVRLPDFKSTVPAHKKIIRLSKLCHQKKIEGDDAAQERAESQLAEAASSVWGISADELRVLREAYNELRTLRARRGDSDSGVEDAEED